MCLLTYGPESDPFKVHGHFPSTMNEHNIMSELFPKENPIPSCTKSISSTMLEFGLGLQRSDRSEPYYSSPQVHKSLFSMRQYQGLHKPLLSLCSASADSSFSTDSPVGAPFTQIFYISFILEHRNTGL